MFLRRRAPLLSATREGVYQNEKAPLRGFFIFSTLLDYGSKIWPYALKTEIRHSFSPAC